MANKKKSKLKAAEITPNHKYKDRVFRMIFKDKRKLLDLYNAINGTNYKNTEDLTITTLENAIYMGMHNDVSFILHEELMLYEHQSTDNPNMPLRNLFYVSDVYSRLVYNKELHQVSLIRIPEPKFVVFYNGVTEKAERWEQKLSDAYPNISENPALELRTTVLNINLGKNRELAEKCRSLMDYMKLVAKIRTYTKLYPNNLRKAIETAVDECIREDIMADFLMKNRAEVIKMSIYEYNAERVRQTDREYGLQQGIERGRQEILVKLLCYQLKKGIDPYEAASEMGEDLATVEQIIKIAQRIPGEYNWQEILHQLREQTQK